MAPKPTAPRVVTHRRGSYTPRHLIVIDQDREQAWTEAQGEVIPLDSLIPRLPTLPSSIVVIPDTARFLTRLDEYFSASPRWQYRVTPLKRQVYRANREMTTWTVASTLVNFFGWQRATRKETNLYHYPIDPHLFTRSITPGLLSSDGPDRLTQLIGWAHDLREWCKKENLVLSPTSGGLAAQLLKDPRWWPEARRKVPRATNARMRPRLPGNYYRLYAEEGEPYQAHYLDMKSAHHTIASQIAFPDPDTLNARGYFHVPDDTDVTVVGARPWVRSGTRAYDRIVNESHGLLYCRIHAPHSRAETFAPPYMRNPGAKMVWLYTNEVPLVRELGGLIEYVTGAWVSSDTAPGLNNLAQWAIGELAESSDHRKQWLKPTLLAAYGILASSPRETEYAYKRAKGGEPRRYPAGSSLIEATAFTGGTREAPLVNVLYRGLIEAEQRTRSIRMARLMHSYGFRVLAIYADSVFIETGPPLPLLPPEWRLEANLDGLIFNSATHFTSRQITKLPGIKRDTLERVQLMAQIRGHKHSY